MDWMGFILSVVSGLAAAIPLVIKLVEYVRKAVREKNWDRVLNMVMDWMEVAEGKFETGAERKEWVLAMVQASADTVNYDINLDVIGAMIDKLCNMSKIVNAPQEVA